jgi:1-deoxy-D-xylulose-5-phosphate synthase
VVTRKGQGYKLAEADPILYHGGVKFDHRRNRRSPRAAAGKPTYTQVFGDWLCDIAAGDDKAVGITPAMREGSGMVRFAQEFPSASSTSASPNSTRSPSPPAWPARGFKPVVAIYSTFLQRGYDQLIHDIALQNLPVTFAIDRAGLAGADGATHHGAFDLSFLHAFPTWW